MQQGSRKMVRFCSWVWLEQRNRYVLIGLSVADGIWACNMYLESITAMSCSNQGKAAHLRRVCIAMTSVAAHASSACTSGSGFPRQSCRQSAQFMTWQDHIKFWVWSREEIQMSFQDLYEILCKIRIDGVCYTQAQAHSAHKEFAGCDLAENGTVRLLSANSIASVDL